MNGFENGCCTHKRLLRVITESINHDVFKCESCNRHYGVYTLSDVTMKTTSSSSSSRTMDVDVNSTQETNLSSALNYHQTSCVTMKTAASAVSAASTAMEVYVNSTESSSSVGEQIHQDIKIASNKLAEEFDDINEKLGQGGFGSVSKYMKKSDGRLYAIKRTEVNDDGRGIKKEVDALSKLEHKNIVRYYNCWCESSSNNGKVMLHIQMEFCEKGTLRETIKSRDPAKNRFRMWKLFRQIVKGIKYFHSKGVIHRDLKPENIFLSSNDCVKIGDFGVATADLQQTTNHRRILYGTDLYYAPEMAFGEYDNKVDMYSLGIIFYEMCSQPFETSSERKQELEKMRQQDFAIPRSRMVPVHLQGDILLNYFEPVLLTTNMVEIINRLLDHDPSKRLSAEELLKSSEMHPPLFNKKSDFFQFVDFLLLPRENVTCHDYHELMRRCLAQKTSEGKIRYWLEKSENDVNNMVDHNDSLTLYEHPIILKTFFKRCEERGAQYFQPPTLFPKMTTKEDYRSVGLKELATVLKNDSSRSFVDKHGTLAVLPVNSHESFARHVVIYNIKEFKRYCVNQVYNDHNIGPPPEPSIELAFDVVSSSPFLLQQSDAEVIQVFHKILQEFSLPSFVLHLNHHSLLKAILMHCKVPEVKHSEAWSLLESKLSLIRNGLDGYTTSENDQLKAKLNEIFSPESLKLALELSNVCGDLRNVKTKLTSFPGWIGSKAAKLADEAFNELEEIINIFQNQESSSTCLVSINLNTGIEYYRTHSGFLFSFIHQSNGFFHGTITNNELAKGGRYDALVQSFRKVIINQPFRQLCDDDRQKKHVTGGVIYVNNLFRFIEKK